MKHMLKGAIAALVMVGVGVPMTAEAVNTLFSETFGTATTGCSQTPMEINDYGNWVGSPTIIEFNGAKNWAWCNTGLWPPVANEYLDLNAETGDDGEAWGRHSFSTPSGSWSMETDIIPPCFGTWGSDFFSAIEAIGMARVGFNDNDYSLDVQNGSSVVQDVYTFTCGNVYHLKLTFANSTATTYTLDINSGAFTASYNTQSTTTPTEIRFGVQTTGNDRGRLLVDNVEIKDQL